MPTTTSWILAAAVLCAGTVAHAEDTKGEKARKDVPRYTDEDLRRVSPRRDQTGGMQPPAPAPAAERQDRAQDGGNREEYWRREADRLRARLEPLRERAALLRSQIEDRRRTPGVRPYSDPRVESLQRRLAAVEERIRDAEDRLHERARRAGAWPSWLR